MSTVPKTWAEVKVGDVFAISTGKLDANAAVDDGQFPFFTCAEHVSQIDQFSFDCQAVLLAGNGGFSVKKYDGKFDAYQRTYVLEPTGLDLNFAYNLIRKMVPEITSSNRGSTIKYLRLGDITEVTAKIPPLPEQRRIVEKLDRLSARSASARDHLAHTTTLATRAKQAILDTETVQGTADCETALVADIAANMFDGPFGSNLKSNDYTDAGVRVVRLENIGVMEFRSDKITHVSEEKFEGLQRHSLQPEDLVFSSFVADDVRAALIPADLGPAINKADCFCIRSDRDIIDPTYLLYRLSARQTYWDMEKLVHGATRPRIGLKHLKAYEITLPSINRQKDIVRRIKAAFSRINRLTDEATRAAHLVDRLDERLLAKAFAGELVPQDPNDEPAEALLARIREARAAAPKPTRGRKKKAAAE